MAKIDYFCSSTSSQGVIWGVKVSVSMRRIRADYFFQNGRNGRKTAEMAGKRPENRLKLPKSTIYAQVLQARGHMGCQNFRLDEADQRRPNFFQNGRNVRKTAEMAVRRPENKLKWPKSTISAQVLEAMGSYGVSKSSSR